MTPVSWVRHPDGGKAHATVDHLSTLCGISASRMVVARGGDRCWKCQGRLATVGEERPGVKVA